jgi:hypothetical protein
MQYGISISIELPSHGRAGLGACFVAILIRRARFPSCVTALLSDLNVRNLFGEFDPILLTDRGHGLSRIRE